MNKIEEKIENELKVAESTRLGYSVIKGMDSMVALCDLWIDSLNIIKMAVDNENRS